MATAPLDTGETEQGGEFDDGAQTQPRDIEADARIQGWTPAEEFKGDPAKWVDAETFVQRGEERATLATKRNKVLEREMEQMKRDMRREFARLDERDKATYERARAEIETGMREAAGVGDLAEFDRLKAAADKLAPAQTGPSIQQEAQEALTTWEADNSWYAQGALPAATDMQLSARAYADRLAESMAPQAQSMKPAEFYNLLAERVKERFPDLDGKTAPRPKPNSAVSGGTQPRGRGGKTAADLPADALATADRYIRKGIIKDRAEYAKTFFQDA